MTLQNTTATPTLKAPKPSTPRSPQRDFGLYLVNMFDTGQAARVLGYPSASLAHLLAATAGFSADKRFQLADWRTRPLSDAMKAYARGDTHFLLHAYDVLKTQLASADAAGGRVPASYAVALPPHAVPLVRRGGGGGGGGGAGEGSGGGELAPAAGPVTATVLERSRQICLKTYEKELLTPGSAAEAAARWGLSGLSAAQSAAFAGLYAWRDALARALDESTGYVLPRAQLSELALRLPGGAEAVRRLLGAHGAPPALARAGELAEVIAKAQREAAAGAAAAAVTQQAPAAAAAQTPAPAVAAQGQQQQQQEGVATADGVGAAAEVPKLVAKAVAPLAMRARPGGSMLRMGGGGGGGMAAALKAAPPPAAAAASAVAPPAGGPAPARPSGMAALMGARGAAAGAPPPAAAPEDARGKLDQLRASFAVPFMSAPPQQQAQPEQQQEQEDGAQAAAAGGVAEDAGTAKPSAADVRAVADALRAEAGAEAGGGGGQQEGGDAEMAPAEEEGSEEEEEDDDDDPLGGADGYIPLAQLVAPKGGGKRGHGGGGGGGRGRGGGGAAGAKRQRGAAWPPPEPQAAGDAAARERRLFQDVGLEDGSSSGDDSDADRVEIAGAAAAIAAAQGGAVPGAGVGAAAAAAAAAAGAGDDAPEEAGRRGRGRGTRGGRGGRGRRGRGGARGAALAAAAASLAEVRRDRGGGAPAANPFAIPEDPTVKGGKRSANAPRSGNRTATFG
jgi:exosome complex exonuclease RRP6